jgi:hypothetical protein
VGGLLGTGVAATVPGKTPDAESTVTPSSGVNETSAVSLASPLKLWLSWFVARKPVRSRLKAMSIVGLTPFKVTGTV